MRYRTFGLLEWRPSALGFGAMRLPLLHAGRRQARVGVDRVDRDAATEMLHHAVDHGVNYVDTAYNYHGGASEAWLGQALQGGYRERVMVATKLPAWECATRADFERLFSQQLERLQLPAVDFYLLHSLVESTWRKVRDLGVLEWAEGALADGRIGHFGFSFHDRYEAFEEIVNASDLWTFCQIQLNYMDTDHQAGLRGLRWAASKGLGVIVMEPVRGGQLAKAPPRIQRLWDEAPVRRSPAEWALQWVWHQPEVSVVLSGMSTLEQVKENVAAAGRSGPGTLTEGELALVGRVRDTYRELAQVDCTGCGYCAPCPNGVDVAHILELVNDTAIYDDLERERQNYSWIGAGARADRCTACGECEERCPQHLAVAEWMQRADRLLGGGSS
jgi:hypothetical protein